MTVVAKWQPVEGTCWVTGCRTGLMCKRLVHGSHNHLEIVLCTAHVDDLESKAAETWGYSGAASPFGRARKWPWRTIK